VLITAECNIEIIVTVRVFQRYGVNRANHVSHSDYYINWGEPIVSLSPKVGSEPIGKNMYMINNYKMENVKRIIGSRISS